MNAAELEEAVLSLPAGRRRALADLIEASLDDPGDPAWVEAWSRTAERRLAELRNGGVIGLEADAALAEVRAAVRSCA